MTPETAPAPRYRITLRNVIGITLLTALIVVIGGIIVVQLDPTISTPERPVSDQLLWLGLLLLAGVVLSTGYVITTRTQAGWGLIGLNPAHPRWFLIAAATASALFFIGERLDHAFGFGIIAFSRDFYGPSVETQVGLLSLFFVMGVVLPVAMELYFRGVLLTYLRQSFPMEASVGLTSLLFALTYFHPDNPVNLVYGLIHGVAFAILVLRSGSLWTSVVAYGTLNLLLLAKVAWA